MKNWLLGLISKPGSWLASLFIDKVLKLLVDWAKDLWAKIQRGADQKKHQKEIEKDVQEGVIRNEETRKTEEDWRNS